MNWFVLHLILLLLATPVSAGPDRISILLGSHHAGAQIDFTERNPGLFVTWEKRALGLDYSVGAYRNSYGGGSVAVTAALPLVSWSHGQAAVFAGLAHYPRDGRTFALQIGDVVPLAGLQLRHGNFFAQILPADGRTADGVVAFGLTFKMGE